MREATDQFKGDLNDFFSRRHDAAIQNNPEYECVLEFMLGAIEKVVAVDKPLGQEVEAALDEYVAVLEKSFYQSGFYDGMCLSMTATANSLSLKDVS